MGIGRLMGGLREIGGRAASQSQRMLGNATREVTQAAQQAPARLNEARSQIASAAQERTRDAFEDLNRRAGAIRDGANTVRNQASGTLRNVITEGRDWVQDRASDARSMASATRNAVGDTFEAGQSGAKRTLRTFNAATNDLSQNIDATARRAGPAFVQTMNHVVQTNPTVASVRTLIDDFNLDRQVDRLRPGSSISIGSYTEGNIKAFAGKTESTLEVRRSEEAGGGYTVSTSSELGAGLAIKLGLRLGAGASAGAEAFRTQGTKLEFHFDTAEEAKRAANIIQEFNAARALDASMPLAGLVANQIREDPRADFASLTRHISAVEYEVGTEASGSLELDLRVSGNLGLGGNKTTTARIEMEGGRPQRMTLTQSFEVNFNGGASAGPDLRVRGASLSGPTNLSIGGDRTLKVAMEQSVDIPERLAVAGLMPTSAEATRLAMRLGVADTREARLTVTDSARADGGALDVNGAVGDEVKLEFHGNVHEIRNSGALGSLARGRPGQAMDQLRGKVHMSATVQESRTYSRDLGLGARLGVVGAEGGFVAERTSVGQARNVNMPELIGHYLTRR